MPEESSIHPLHGVLTRFFVIYIPLALLTSLIVFSFYYSDRQNRRLIVENTATQTLNIATYRIATELDTIGGDLAYLADQPELYEMLEKDNALFKRLMAFDYLSMARNKKLYDQIRFIDETGMERVRVNFDNGRPFIVPETELQSKVQRYYFTDAIRLARGNVYISPFDLNIEHDQIEQPQKPMIRLATPVFDRTGHKRGIVILNYLGARLITRLKELAPHPADNLMLLNAEGYWLMSPLPKDEWGFMFDTRRDRKFGQEFPAAWKRISEGETGQFYDRGGLFTFVTVHPFAHGEKRMQQAGADQGDYQWKIVSYLPQDLLTSRIGKSMKMFASLQATFLVVLGIVCAVWARGSVRRQQDRLEIMRLNQDLLHRTADLENSNHELEAFAYSVSHDLRAPLRHINSFSAILQEDHLEQLNDEGRNCLERISNASRNMGKLIDSLLELARVSRVEINREPVDLGEMGSTIIREYGTVEPERRVQFTTAGKLTAHADPQLARLILQNLLGNAWKYTSTNDTATIAFGVETINGEPTFFVRDNGVGFDMQYADKLFRPFHRLHRQEEFEGTGIGLATVQRIVHRHGGKIWAKGEVGRGTTVYFTLLRRESATTPPEQNR